MTIRVFGLRPALTTLDGTDTQSLQKLFDLAARSLPDTDSLERKQKVANIPQEGKGIFTPNGRKTNPMQPDWKGQIMHNGELIRFSGWIKQSQYGEFQSLAVDKWKPGDPSTKAPVDRNKQSYPQEVKDDYDSDVPF